MTRRIAPARSKTAQIARAPDDCVDHDWQTVHLHPTAELQKCTLCGAFNWLDKPGPGASVFSPWNACCYREQCRENAKAVADTRTHRAPEPLPFTLTDDEPTDDFRRFWVGLFVGVVLGSAVQVALLAWAVSL